MITFDSLKTFYNILKINEVTNRNSAIETALTTAKSYADTAVSNVKNDLLNGAGAAYDTLKELGDLIDDNTDAIDALEAVASGKADKTHSHAISEVTNLQSTLDTKLPSTTKYAGSSSAGGAANSANKVNITRPANVLTAAVNMAIHTEEIFFLGSDGLSAGAPVNYCIINAKRGLGERTLLDCYDLQTGDHYINGNMSVSNPDTWTGWILQPNGTTIDTISGNISNVENSLNAHTENTNAHITYTERTNWNAAKTHADSAHVQVQIITWEADD